MTTQTKTHELLYSELPECELQIQIINPRTELAEKFIIRVKHHNPDEAVNLAWQIRTKTMEEYHERIKKP